MNHRFSAATFALAITVVAFVPFVAHASDWFVRPSSAGANNGTTWNDAWSIASLNSSWSHVGPGDTIWLAGGTYTTGIRMERNGTSAAWIHIKRVTASDSAATSAAGWSAAFDAQVVIQASDGVWFDTPGTGNFIDMDGRVMHGIRLQFPCDGFSSSSIYFSAGGMHDLSFENIDMAGPGGTTPYNYAGDCSVIGLRTSSSGGGAVYNFTVTDSDLHGGPNLVYNLGANHGFLFLRDRFFDNGSSNSSIHANMVYTAGGNYDWTFANDEFFNWQVEGINLYQQTSNPHYFYGNLFHDPMEGGARCFWLANESGSPTGPVFLYNNTFVGVTITTSESRASMATSSSIARNNIYWNATFAATSSITDSDYDFSNGSTPGSHSVSSGSNPFVNLAGHDFHIVSTLGAHYPRDLGVSLSNPYPVDRDGNTRGADGAWDIGAYEYCSGTGCMGPPLMPDAGVTMMGTDAGVVMMGHDAGVVMMGRDAGVMMTVHDAGIMMAGHDAGVTMMVPDAAMPSHDSDAGTMPADDDAHVTLSADGGASQHRDATTGAPDGSSAAPPLSMSGGCGCRVSDQGSGRAPAWLFGTLLAPWAIRRRVLRSGRLKPDANRRSGAAQ